MLVKVFRYDCVAPEEVNVKCFEDIQGIVGGLVEVPLWDIKGFPVNRTPERTILVNGEGLVQGLPLNPNFTRENAFVGHIVVAPEGWEDLPYCIEEGEDE